MIDDKVAALATEKAEGSGDESCDVGGEKISQEEVRNVIEVAIK